MFDVPILFLVYKRADTAEKVLDAISKIQPSRLFISCNAPNPLQPGDDEKVQIVRRLIDSKINWPCKLEKLYRTEHLSAGESLYFGMKWFFETVGEGIVFEDDTLPDISFFHYCKELLAYYRDDENVRMINGNNFQKGNIRGDGSYYYSKYIHSWGYASWLRAWKDYDFTLERIDHVEFKDLLNRQFTDEKEKAYWWNVFENIKSGKYKTWDYQFLFSLWKTNGISITPNRNLVTNIGFGNDATHTVNVNDPAANNPTQSIEKIVHPTVKKVFNEADRFFFKHFIKPKNNWKQILKNKFRKFFPN